MCACLPVLSPPASARSLFFSRALSEGAGMCTGYQLWGHLAFQEWAGLLQQSGLYLMFSSPSGAAELNGAAVLTTAGKRLSKVPLSLCRPPACRTLCASLLPPCSWTVVWWCQSLWYFFVPTLRVINFQDGQLVSFATLCHLVQRPREGSTENGRTEEDNEGCTVLI